MNPLHRRRALDHATGIYNEWDRRRRGKASFAPYDTAHSYLKRAVYDFVQDPDLSKNQYLGLKRLVVRERNDVSRAPAIEENPFFWGFLLVFADDESLARSDRSKFAAELLYAYKHDVPAELLVGFIYQVGGYARIRQKLKQGEMEAWGDEDPRPRQSLHPTRGKSDKMS